ncbi:protein SUPPRESSOR OF FRI 4 [Pelomyxa schiedti]|nr:protein SUPPRESSOR OF FRI 4 [Pelomyxa schiedti]
MGKRKKKATSETRPWCWYCDRTFEDEKILIQHQKAKHFKCHVCHKKMSTAGGLTIHVSQVHKENISKIPNSKPNRDTVPGPEICGMDGIPEDDVLVHEAKEKGEDPDLYVKLKHQEIIQNALPPGLLYPMQNPFMPGFPMPGALPYPNLAWMNPAAPNTNAPLETQVTSSTPDPPDSPVTSTTTSSNTSISTQTPIPDSLPPEQTRQADVPGQNKTVKTEAPNLAPTQQQPLPLQTTPTQQQPQTETPQYPQNSSDTTNANDSTSTSTPEVPRSTGSRLVFAHEDISMEEVRARTDRYNFYSRF